MLKEIFLIIRDDDITIEGACLNRERADEIVKEYIESSQYNHWHIKKVEIFN